MPLKRTTGEASPIEYPEAIKTSNVGIIILLVLRDKSVTARYSSALDTRTRVCRYIFTIFNSFYTVNDLVKEQSLHLASVQCRMEVGNEDLADLLLSYQQTAFLTFR